MNKEGMSKDEVLKTARMQANYVLQLVNIINNDDNATSSKDEKVFRRSCKSCIL